MAYATVTDVLRVLGGTEDLLKQRFGRLLWNEEKTEVTVDTATFEVPDLVLARIADRLLTAESLIDAYVLQAYKAKPTVVPPHLRDACAWHAGLKSLHTDGAIPEYFRQATEENRAYLKDLAAGKLDLGLGQDPRPAHKRPAPYFSSGRPRSCGGCG